MFSTREDADVLSLPRETAAGDCGRMTGRSGAEATVLLPVWVLSTVEPPVAMADEEDELRPVPIPVAGMNTVCVVLLSPASVTMVTGPLPFLVRPLSPLPFLPVLLAGVEAKPATASARFW